MVSQGLPNAFNNDILGEVFEGDPLGRQALFFGSLPGNLLGQQRQALQDQFGSVFSRYLGQLANDPSRRFTDFLGEDFNPLRELNRLPGSSVGFGRAPTIFNLR